MKTEIPGISAAHAIITDACRVNRGDAGAIDEALARAKNALGQIVEGWEPGKGARFHVVVTVERPD